MQRLRGDEFFIKNAHYIKTIYVMLVIVSLGCFVLGCSSDKSEEQSENKKVSSKEISSSIDEAVCNDLDVVGFKVYDSAEGFREYDVILKNNSNQTINTVSVNVQYLDERGYCGNFISTSSS